VLFRSPVTNLTVTEEEAQRLEAEADQELTAKAARYLPPAAIKPVLEESSETSSNGDSGETVPSSPEGSSADETTGETAE
jgi:hypothetical protein